MENDQVKILAIDDIADNLISLKALIGEAFPEAIVFTSTSGDKGLETAIREDPDIILLDIVMPGMDGFEVCRRLKGDKKLAEIPVIFTTALKGDKENRIKALEAGADGFLTKPVDESELTAQVKAMLKIRAANKIKRQEKEQLSSLIKERTRELEKELWERKMAEQALFTSEQNMTDIFETVSDGIAYTDFSGYVLAVNSSLAKIVGKPKEEIVNKNILDLTSSFISFSEAGRILQLLKKLLSGRDIPPFEVTFGDKILEVSSNINRSTSRLTGVIRDVTEKKLAEIALQEKESRLQKIFDILPVGLWFADKDGTLLSGNPAGIRIWGAEPKVAISEYGVFKARRLPSREEIAPEDWALVRTVKEGVTVKDELLEIDGFDGKKRIILNYTAPILDNDGVVQGAIVVNNDITARVEAEEKLRLNEERLAFSLEATNDGLWDWNIITNEIYFSPQYYRMLGYEPGEFTATYESWRELIFPEDYSRCEKKVLKAVAECGSYQSEFRMRTSDGGWRWILDRGKVIETNHNGKAVRMVGTHVDITERNQVKLIKDIQYNIARKTFEARDVETLLSLIRDELGRLLDISHFAAALYDADKHTLTKLPFSNDETVVKKWPARSSLSGMVVKTGKTLFLNTPDIEQFLQENHLVTSGSPACWLGVPIKINNIVAGAMVIKSYTDPNAYSIANIALMELVAHEVGMFIDRQNMLESLIDAKEKAEESDRLKSAFISNISHEIRTPLNGIIGFGQIMAEQEVTDEEKSLYLSVLKSSSDRLLQTITDYMDMARIVSGTQEVAASRFLVKGLLEEIAGKYKEICANKNLSLNIILPEEYNESLITSDRELIYKTIQQLIDNAIKFTDEGEVAIGLKMKGDTCEFFVRDTGRGIGANKLIEIFNMFTQEETSLTRGYEGSGLGLAIAKGVVELLGGEIYAFSEKGKGSIFSFTLPADRTQN